MKAYLIDPYTLSVEEVEVTETNGNNLASIYGHIDCSCIATGFMTDNDDTCFVDDEGFYKGHTRGFMIDLPRYAEPIQLIGRGLVLGCNMNTGESTDVKTDISEFVKKVKFFEVR
jgi:hypothetical protein